MTAAQIRSAAAILYTERVEDPAIVSLVELGSEGALLRLGHLGSRSAAEFLISRSGEWRKRP